MPENTAEGDPAVFFVCHKKHKTTLVGYHAGLQKNTQYFCGIRELTKGYGGGKLNSSKPEGFRLGVKKL